MLPVTRLFSGLKVYESMALGRSRPVWGIPVYLGAVRTKDEYAIIISIDYTPTLVADLALRWEIETLFGCMKSRGFDMEQTRMRDHERLSKLFPLLTIAFCWCYRVGEWKAEQKPIRVLKHERQAVSLFCYGLDCLNRILFTSTEKGMDKFVQMLRLLFNDTSKEFYILNQQILEY